MSRRLLLRSAVLVGAATIFGVSGCSSDAEQGPTEEGRKADEKQFQESAEANDRAAGKGRRR